MELLESCLKLVIICIYIFFTWAKIKTINKMSQQVLPVLLKPYMSSSSVPLNYFAAQNILQKHYSATLLLWLTSSFIPVNKDVIYAESWIVIELFYAKATPLVVYGSDNLWGQTFNNLIIITFMSLTFSKAELKGASKQLPKSGLIAKHIHH